MTIASAGPIGEGVTLIVGMGVATYAAMLATLGYFANRFLNQQRSNHADTLEALTLLRTMQSKLPKHDRRLKRLEHIHEPLARRRWHARRLERD